MTSPDFTHLDAQGRARMVDVGDKPETSRVAIASGRLRMNASTLHAITTGDVAKGDVLAVARVAGIQAAKETGRLIPLCHPLGLDSVTVEFEPHGDDVLAVTVEARVVGKTGVEMEALVAASTALLTVYDMCKAKDRGMVIENVQLEKKSGGRSGEWTRKRAGE